MPRSDFTSQLKKLGYEGVSEKNGFIVFDYVVEVGKIAGKKITMAFQVGDDFPLNPPSGPHISPRLLPIQTTQGIPHPNGGIHPSDKLGSEWEYWSRPFPNWNQTDRSVRTYMAFIRRLFEDQ